ncbi:LytR C-terminal domain-containing protein [Corynebacterium riegelii]|uniref:LytR C-terminal domain-containing protein n=1 Tax=Corynebacterium riegelii TaxID=156976 RepID=UPI00191FEDBC|nr:LytR C-terminal domain-containing protein [Corynebacterium riegelii]QQU84267.1 LytR C-terminal domain-containing protein [Corynebacterium riegelii]
MTTNNPGNRPSDDNRDEFVGDEFVGDTEYIADTEYTDYPGHEPDQVAGTAASVGAEEYTGAHRREDYNDAEYSAAYDAEYGDAEYDDAAYDDAYIDAYDDDDDNLAAGAAGAGAAGAARGAGGRRRAAAGAGAAGAGVPKRGLAMILIAVAALLLLWGIYALTQKSSDANTGAATTETTAVDSPDGTNSALPPAPETVPTNANPADPNAEGQENEPADPNASADPNAPADPANPADPNAPAPAPAPNDGGPAITAQNAQVFVYNNSNVNGWAADTMAKLDGNFQVANTEELNDPTKNANMPEGQYGTFEGVQVFYPESTEGARQVAEEIARQLGGVAVAKTDGVRLPPNTNARDAIVVVLAENH